MKIKTVFKILNEIRYIRSVLKCYSGSLACGKYYQHNSFCALSLDSPDIRKKSHLYFDKNDAGKRMISIAEKINSIGFFRNKNKNSDEEYEGFYIANNYDKIREVKLFSFRNNKILTICTSEEEAEKQIAQYNLLSTAYRMPKVIKNGKYNNSFEIAMVSLKEMGSESLALDNIALSTVANNESIHALNKVAAKEFFDFDYESEINAYLQRIVDKIDPLLIDIQLPLCIQHGDLSKENLIYGECDGVTDFWWIDWEHIGERVFFYDYYFYIVNSSFYYDMKAFESYINGEGDDRLKDFFLHFGVDFDKRKKLDYLLIFLVAFLKERICSKSGLPVLKKYYELVEKMEIYAKGEKNDNED